MNKAQLVDLMAVAAGSSKKQATTALQTFVAGIEKALKKGERVTLVGFGTFAVTKRAARKGRNPATGESIRIKAKKVVKFRAAKELLERL